MIYEADTIVNCSMQLFQLMQPIYDPFEIEVSAFFVLVGLTSLGPFTLQHNGHGILYSSDRLQCS
jgi:hypothetical protein